MVQSTILRKAKRQELLMERRRKIMQTGSQVESPEMDFTSAPVDTQGLNDHIQRLAVALDSALQTSTQDI
jgi:hypothetical protein